MRIHIRNPAFFRVVLGRKIILSKGDGAYGLLGAAEAPGGAAGGGCDPGQAGIAK